MQGIRCKLLNCWECQHVENPFCFAGFRACVPDSGANIEKFILQNSYPHRRQERDSENPPTVPGSAFYYFLQTIFNQKNSFLPPPQKGGDRARFPPKTQCLHENTIPHLSDRYQGSEGEVRMIRASISERSESTSESRLCLAAWLVWLFGLLGC